MNELKKSASGVSSVKTKFQNLPEPKSPESLKIIGDTDKEFNDSEENQ